MAPIAFPLHMALLHVPLFVPAAIMGAAVVLIRLVGRHR